MKPKEYDHVRIKASGITGIIVDVYTVGGSDRFIVESDEKGVPGGYGGADSWKLFHCTESEIEKV